MARYPKNSTPKLTQQLIEDISLLLRRGAYIESAAAACGISKDTLYRWLKNGKRDENQSLEKKLTDAVMKAMAEAEMKDLEVIDKAAQGSSDKFLADESGKLILDGRGRPIIEEVGMSPDWKASAWRLERRFPQRWGRKVDLQIDDQSSSNIEIVFVDPNPSSIPD